MKKNNLKIVFAYLFIGVAFSCFSQTLYPGDKAPEIKLGEWVKGTPVTKFARNHIYILEFWATWCGPCKAAVPHLNSLAEKYKGKVDVIAVSVWEKNYKDVALYVSHSGDDMNYNVAYDYQPTTDPNSGFMTTNWLKAADLNGIPTTFIIGKKGNIEYIGYPDASLDSVLELIVNDKWDIASYDARWRNAHKEEKARTEQKQKQREQQQAAWNVHPVKQIMDRIQQSIQQQQYDAALSGTDTLEKMDLNGFPYTPTPILANELRMDIYTARENKTEYFESFDKMLELVAAGEGTGGYMAVNEIIWRKIVDPKAFNLSKDLRDYNFAIKWMKRVVAYEEEKDPASLDTLAWAYFGNADKRSAIHTEKKALALIAKDDPQRNEFEKALQTFQK